MLLFGGYNFHFVGLMELLVFVLSVLLYWKWSLEDAVSQFLLLPCRITSFRIKICPTASNVPKAIENRFFF